MSVPMPSHYERLKVSPDAPAEVIRAAYRALITRDHPELLRATGEPGGALTSASAPKDAAQAARAQADLVALNNSYLVLSNPVARAAYDASLRRVTDDGFAPTQILHPEADPDAFADTHQELDWPAMALTSASPSAPSFTPPTPPTPPASPGTPAQPLSQKWLIAGFAAGLLVLTLCVLGYLWRESRLAKADRSMSRPAVSVAPPANGLPPGPGEVTPTSAAMPTLSAERLSTLSNQELLAVLPQLLGGGSLPAPTSPPAATPAVAAPVPSARPAPPAAPVVHPLDGTRLDLKLAPMKRPSPPSAP